MCKVELEITQDDLNTVEKQVIEIIKGIVLSCGIMREKYRDLEIERDELKEEIIKLKKSIKNLKGEE